MAAQNTDDLFDDFLSQRGHEIDDAGWEESYNKLQCPDCGGLHDRGVAECTVCGWAPAAD